MANRDNAFGLRPVCSKNGSPWNGKVTMYYIPATYAVDVFIGDTVLKTGTANAAEVQGFKIGTLPAVAKAAATGAITGVVTGFLPVNDDSKVYGVASGDRVAFVCDDPEVVFQVQSAGTVAITDIGANANQVLSAGSTVTGISANEISATTATTAATQLKILRLSNVEKNEIGLNAVVDVIINNHTESNNTVAI